MLIQALEARRAIQGRRTTLGMGAANESAYRTTWTALQVPRAEQHPCG
jgi:hypothetical protein